MIKEIIKIRDKLNDLRTLSAQFHLEETKSYQKGKFYGLLPKFKRNYNSLRKYNLSKFILPRWVEDYKRIENSFWENPFGFLRNTVIKETMFCTDNKKLIPYELALVREAFDLEEEYVGLPELYSNIYVTSKNTIHTAFHIHKYEEDTNKEIAGSIVEWGAGYGNMARILKKHRFTETMVLIDLPFFSCLQWIYLATVFGEEEVHLITSRKQEIKKGKINLLPVCFVEHFDLQADTFISTWALTESSQWCQKFVVENDFFGAKNILLALQNDDDDNFNAFPIKEYCYSNDLLLQPIKHLEHSSYVFK